MALKMVSFVMVTILVFSVFSGEAMAAATTTEEGPMNKFGRGLLNVLDAVVEIPGTMMREGSEEGVASGLSKGVILGVVNTVIRTLVGVYEVATFPIPNENGYSQILDDPKFLTTE